MSASLRAHALEQLVKASEALAQYRALMPDRSPIDDLTILEWVPALTDAPPRLVMAQILQARLKLWESSGSTHEVQAELDRVGEIVDAVTQALVDQHACLRGASACVACEVDDHVAANGFWRPQTTEGGQ